MKIKQIKTNAIFAKKNIDALKKTCEQIISLCNESVEGELMISQKMFLAERLKDFKNNPIVDYSGIL